MMSVRLIKHLTGIGIALAYLAVLIATSDIVGIARDETFRIQKAKHSEKWFRELPHLFSVGEPFAAWSKPYAEKYWNERGNVRPTVMQPVMGLGHFVFDPIVGSDNEMLAYRLPAMILSALLVYLIFLMATDLGGIFSGIAAAFSFILLPRIFFHAHLACLDVPVTAFSVLGLFAFSRAISRKEHYWIPLAVIGISFSLAAKNSLVFIAAPLGIFLVAAIVRSIGKKKGNFVYRGISPRTVYTYIWIIIIAGLFFLVSWPPFVADPFNSVLLYMSLYLDTPHHPWMYLGYTLGQPPFPVSYPFVYTAMTVPVPFLILSAAGICIIVWDLLKKRSDGLGNERFMIVLMAFIPILLIAHPSVHIYGGTKHWMLSMPYLCVAFGLAMTRVIGKIVELITNSRIKVAVAAALGVFIFIPAILGTVATARWGHTYYNSISGWNGMASGMQIQYWGDSTVAALDWINENLPAREKIFLCRTEPRAAMIYRKTGWLRPDITWTTKPGEAKWHIIHYQQTFYKHLLYVRSRREIPYFTATTWDGMPIVSVFGPPPDKS